MVVYKGSVAMLQVLSFELSQDLVATRAAGLGLEPRLPDSESGCLPLADPAIVLYYIKGYLRKLIRASNAKASCRFLNLTAL